MENLQLQNNCFMFVAVNKLLLVIIEPQKRFWILIFAALFLKSIQIKL